MSCKSVGNLGSTGGLAGNAGAGLATENQSTNSTMGGIADNEFDHCFNLYALMLSRSRNQVKDIGEKNLENDDMENINVEPNTSKDGDTENWDIVKPLTETKSSTKRQTTKKNWNFKKKQNYK